MLILEECCLRNIPYEILDKVPTENDWDYPVPFIRISKKDKQAWLLLDVTDRKATWLPWVGGGKSQIEKIISSCGELIPQLGVIEITNGDGLEAVCQGNKLTIRIKIPIDTNIGGTGQTKYNENDLLIGDNTGKLKKLGKGQVGQFLGVKEDGSVGYISASIEAPIQIFSVYPCGELTPDSVGKVGLELSEDFTCELNKEGNIAKVNVKIPTSDGINKIITPCGTIEPVDNTVKLTMTEGLDTICNGNELITKLKVPVATNLGGTGLQQYNKGDVLIGKEDGTLEKLPKGSVGQVLGIKENDSIGYIPINVDVPIKKFSISPCGDLTPNNQGKIGLELNDGFTCELNQDKNIAKIGIKNDPSSLSIKCLAYLPRDVDSVTGKDNDIYELGTTVEFNIFSEIGKGFYPGNVSNRSAAYYKCIEKGDYLFNLLITYNLRLVTPNIPTGNVTVYLDHYDSSNNLISSYRKASLIRTTAFYEYLSTEITKSIIMNQGDIVKFKFSGILTRKQNLISIYGVKPTKFYATYLDIYKVR